MTDSMPIATGFREFLSFRLISQATSQPWGAGPNEYCLMSSTFGDDASVLRAARGRPREELGVVRSRAFHGEGAARESGVFAQLQSFVISMGARRSKIMTRKAWRDQRRSEDTAPGRALSRGSVLDARDGAGGGLSSGFAQASVIASGRRRMELTSVAPGGEIERGDVPPSLASKAPEIGRGKEQLVGAVGVVVQKFDTSGGARRESAGQRCLGANKIAPGIVRRCGAYIPPKMPCQ